MSKIECLKSVRAGFQAPLSPAAKSRLYSVVLTSLVHAGKSPGGISGLGKPILTTTKNLEEPQGQAAWRKA